MSAANKNFNIAFWTLTGIGVAGLGYLLFASMGKLDEAKSEYEAKKSELNTLQTAKAYPNDANKKAAEAERDKLVGKFIELQKALAAAEFPEPDLDPPRFQQELNRALGDITAKAKTANVVLPEKFDLGFNYLTQLPDKDAAKPLGRQLKAMEWLIGQCIALKDVTVKEIKRPELDEEGNKRREATPAPTPNRPGGSKSEAKPEPKLVTRNSFNITFISDQARVRSLLNAITSNKEQFFVVRRVKFTNTKAEAPKKEVVAAVAPADSAAAPVPGAPATPPALPAPADAAPVEVAAALPKMTFVLGEEKVEAEFEIEMLDFAEPVTPKKTAR